MLQTLDGFDFETFRNKDGEHYTGPGRVSDYMKRYMAEKGLSSGQCAKDLGVTTADITQLCQGADLSAELAAKLQLHYGISASLLFKIEAKSKIHDSLLMVYKLSN